MQIRDQRAVSRSVIIAVVVVIVILVVAGGYLFLAPKGTTTSTPTTSTQTTSSTQTASTTPTGSTTTQTSPTSTSSTTSTSTSTTTTTSSVSAPTSLTYETVQTPQYLDPAVGYLPYDEQIIQNVYESLLWYNGSSSTEVIPWLAQSYTLSSNGMSANFTLRPGITFADGEPFNSTAVYFSLNRLLVEDGSTPVTHGTQASWILWQLVNSSMSSTLCGCNTTAAGFYSKAWLNEVLLENFVQITGPLSLTIHINNPNAAFPFLIGSNSWADILAPTYIMQHDIAIWNSSGYTLPFPSLPSSGNETALINEYFQDEIATCNAGATPKGCGTTYLDGSAQGSLAGTGPYEIQGVNAFSTGIVYQANPTYWGGPYQFLGGSKISPQITTITFKYVPQETTRVLDLENAAKSGQALGIDLSGSQLYDVADRNTWLNNNTLTSIFPGVSLYGPYSVYATEFNTFDTNVSNPQTGTYYSFQPFADIRFRLAFADAANVSEILATTTNKLNQPAINVIPPGLPPNGSYNASDVPRYSFNLTAVQDLLLAAMMHPITQFTYENGSPATPGVFNNTFGCTTLSTAGTCAKPVTQSISLVYYVGDDADQAIFEQVASAVNNVSTTYNMGLTVNVVPIPVGQMTTEGLSGQLYAWDAGWLDDYPWAVDFLGAMFSPGQYYTGPDGWNVTQLANLYSQAVADSATNNISALVTVTNQMNEIANQRVLYQWTYYYPILGVFTSSVGGYYFNPSQLGPYYATMT
jgi:peptide/nickel transport system substrate-binding protein